MARAAQLRHYVALAHDSRRSPGTIRTLSKREGGGMADMHVMNALTTKRGELVEQIEDRRLELKQLGEELAHL